MARLSTDPVHVEQGRRGERRCEGKLGLLPRSIVLWAATLGWHVLEIVRTITLQLGPCGLLPDAWATCSPRTSGREDHS
jgi:hypothetical protein